MQTSLFKKMLEPSYYTASVDQFDGRPSQPSGRQVKLPASGDARRVAL